MTFGARPQHSEREPESHGAAGAEQAAATGTSETLIPLPAPGETVVIDLGGLASARFAFDPDTAQATVRGDDLVLRVNDGQVVLVGYLDELRRDELPTLVSPSGEEIFPDALLNRPGGQEPGEIVNSSFLSPESSGGFAPSPEPVPLDALSATGVLGATSLAYSGPHAAESLQLAEFEPSPSPAPPLPHATDDRVVTDEDTPVTIPVLDNDTAAPGFALTVESAVVDKGQVVINPDNTLAYTPPPDFNGAVTITYSVNDGHGGTATAVVTVIVEPVNDPPVAADDAATTAEDEPVTIPALANDTDVDGDKLTATVVDGPAHGALVLNPDGTFTYTPDADFNGTDSFTYKANDGTADSNLATVLITVNPVNDPPLANDDAATTDEDTPVTIPVLANDTDADGDTLTAALVDGPAHGTLVLNPDGTFTYTPAADFNGTDSFTYKANDGAADSTLATVLITVDPVNDPPLAADDAATTAEDAPVTIPVLANDTDVDGDTLTPIPVDGPKNGTLALNPDGTFTYTPAADFNGTDSFTYKVNDGTTDSNIATVTITVDPVNDPPVANDDKTTTAEDTPVTIAVLGNDTDVDGDTLTAALVDGPKNGTLQLNPDGTFTYTPVADFNGTDSFTYKDNDGTVDSNLATVLITVDPVNDPPLANDDEAITDEDTPVTIPVLANDTDVDGDALTAVVVDGPKNGTLALNPDGSFTYTPGADFNGTDSFTYKANDGTADSNLATVLITVNPANDPPLANDDAAITDEDTPVTITVLANDSDPDGDALTVIDASSQTGTVAINPDGTITYTPAADFNGTGTIVYTISDGDGATDTATVTVAVTPVNDSPVATDDMVTTTEDAAVTITVLANDSDPEGDALTAVPVDGPAHGKLTLNPDGTFTYTPDADFNGSDSFTYKANDGAADSNLATVLITVDPVNDPPIADDDAVTTAEDTPVAIAVLDNDTDVDGDTLTAALVVGPAHGTLVLNPDNTFTYTPDADFNGSDSFTYQANDGTAGSNVATVTITVSPENDPPVANDDEASTAEDAPVTIAVLANDTDAENDALAAVLVDGPKNGTLVLNPDGTFTYTPAADFNGTDNFTYKANDGAADSNVAAVTITVGSANDAPVAVDDAVVTDEDTPIGGNVLANDTDADGDALTAALIKGPAHGTLVLNPDGTFTYTPAADFNGKDSFTYQASDGTAGSNVATVLITVNPVNDPPIANDDKASTTEDVPITIDVLANDSDVDGDPLTATLVTGPANGTVVLNPDGTFTYTPNADYSGPDSFTYRASDGTDSDLATVGITVLPPVPDAPDLAVSPANGAEDQAIPLTITASLTDPNELLTITITGVPAAAALSAGTKNADGSWTLTPAQLAGLAITPPANSSDDFTLTVIAISREPGSGATASTTAELPVTVTPVADQPLLTAQSSVVIGAPNQSLSGTQDNDVIVGGFGADNIQGNDGNDLIIGDPETGGPAAPLAITASVTDTDGSEALEVRVSGLPPGGALSAGTPNADGSWTLTPAQLAGLQLRVPPATAPFDLTVSAIVTDRGPDDLVPDTLTTSQSVHVETTATGGDTLGGGNGADTLRGVSGDDNLQGGPGADLLDGGVGNDTIRDDDGAKVSGGDGNDTIEINYNTVFAPVQLEGGAGNDTITIQFNNNPDLGAFGGVQFYGDSSDPAAPSGDDVVTVKGSFTNGTSGNAGIFLGGGNDLLINQAQSTIRIDAGDGNDTLQGSPVSDSMSGGSGNDVIIGGGGNGNDTLDGGAGDDSIAGGLGQDVITAGDGNDTIFGSQQADTITLGNGHSLLLYKDILDGPDAVTGFDKTAGGASQDTIDLDALFDSRGIATNQRAGLVSFVQAGNDVQLHVNVGFDVTVLTFKNMTDTTGLTAGNASTDDVQVGSL